MPLLVNSSPFRVALRIYGSAQGASWDVRRGSQKTNFFGVRDDQHCHTRNINNMGELWLMSYTLLPYYAVLYHIIPCYTILYHIIPHHTILYHIIPYYTILYHIVPLYLSLYNFLPIIMIVCLSCSLSAFQW